MLFQVKANENKENSKKTFLLKLFDILETVEYKEIIHWSKEGNSFIIENLQLFTERILPKYFKHDKFSSFVRQVIYDFHKVKSTKDEYFHNKFSRDYKENVVSIIRKPKNKNLDKYLNNVEEFSIEFIQKLDLSVISKKNTEKIICFLLKNIERLKEIIKNLEFKLENMTNIKDDLIWKNQYILKEMLKKADIKTIETLLYFLIDFIFPYCNNLSDFFKSLCSTKTNNNILPSPEVKNNQNEENSFNFKFIDKSKTFINDFQNSSRILENHFPMLAESQFIQDKLYSINENTIVDLKFEQIKKEEVKLTINDSHIFINEFEPNSLNLNKSPFYEFSAYMYDIDNNNNSPRKTKKKYLERKMKRKDSIFSNNSSINGKSFSDNIFSNIEDD